MSEASKVIAIFGAGKGLGASVARRFAREDFRVALVARGKERLDALVAELKAEGIDATGFTADLSKPEEVPAAVHAIRDHFGRIDVVEYGPISGEQAFAPAAELDAATLEKDSPLLLLTPVEVARAVLPEWTERGDGAFLMTTGATAGYPRPFASGVGPLMAATRNWIFSLNGEVAQAGIYAGTLSIAAFIARSEMGELAAKSLAEVGSVETGPLVDPDELAEQYWDMYTKRDRVEQLYPQA
jgi:NAD(P)-dependent dehydrogenase (short-subunit alcohol dehydrogenase family)